MNTKKINELTILEQATAETNVLVEQNGTASRIPASALGSGGGSEKALIEKLAPAFTKTAPVVTCNPVEGHPLEVVSYLQNIATDLLSGVKQVFDDEAQISYMQTYAPAGEFTAWARHDSEVSVMAYNTKTASWDSLGDVPMNDDYEGTLTFTHNGGLLRVVGSWVFDLEATLKPVVDPTGIAWVSLKHNEEIIGVEFPEAVKGGSFNWSTGVLLAAKESLISVDLTNKDNWVMDEEIGDPVYYLPHLPDGTYTLYVKNNGYGMDIEYDDMGSWSSLAQVAGDGSVTFEVDSENTTMGNCRLHDTSWSSAEEVIKDIILVNGNGVFDTHQLAPHEIIGLAGVNTLSGNTGETEVSGRADPAFVINDLYSKLSALSEG